MIDLRAVTKSALDQSLSADPGDISADVFAAIPTSDYASVLQHLLRAYVRQVIHETRGSNPFFPAGQSAFETHGLAAGGEQAKPRVRSARSGKVRAIREHWKARLDERYWVGEWKFLGDCGFEDLMAAAADRRDQATANLARAAELERYAKVVKRHRVAHLRDLPADVLRDLLEEKAA